MQGGFAMVVTEANLDKITEYCRQKLQELRAWFPWYQHKSGSPRIEELLEIIKSVFCVAPKEPRWNFRELGHLEIYYDYEKPVAKNARTVWELCYARGLVGDSVFSDKMRGFIFKGGENCTKVRRSLTVPTDPWMLVDFVLRMDEYLTAERLLREFEERLKPFMGNEGRNLIVWGYNLSTQFESPRLSFGPRLDGLIARFFSAGRESDYFKDTCWYPSEAVYIDTIAEANYPLELIRKIMTGYWMYESEALCQVDMVEVDTGKRIPGLHEFPNPFEPLLEMMGKTGALLVSNNHGKSAGNRRRELIVAMR